MAMPQVTRNRAATMSQGRTDGRSVGLLRSRPSAAGAGLVDLEGDRTVVRALDRGHDPRGLDAAAQLVRHEEVVDAPSDIAGARARLHVPPRVVPGLGHEDPERVVVAVGDELAHPLALDRHEAGTVLVLLRARDVDLGMGGVDVAAHHDALAPLAQSL